VVLGNTGKNFGAGMTGGSAYIFDENNQFPDLYNTGLVVIERLTPPTEALLNDLISKHYRETDSARAKFILENWATTSGLFWRVIPHPPAPKPSEVKPVASSESVISEKVIATQP
jgi:glutamate synthase domain-containing protein 3